MAFTRNKAKAQYKDGQQPNGNTFSELFDSLVFANEAGDVAKIFDSANDGSVLSADAKVLVQNADGTPVAMKMGLLIDFAGSGKIGVLDDVNFDPGQPSKSVNYEINPSNVARTFTHFLTNTLDGSGNKMPMQVDANTNGSAFYIASGDYWQFIPDVLPDNVLTEDVVGVKVASQSQLDQLYSVTGLKNIYDAASLPFAALNSEVTIGTDNSLTCNLTRTSDNADGIFGFRGGAFTPTKSRYAILFQATDLNVTKSTGLQMFIQLVVDEQDGESVLFTFPYSSFGNKNALGVIVDLPSTMVDKSLNVYVAFNSYLNSDVDGNVNVRIENFVFDELGNIGDTSYGYTLSQLLEAYSSVGYFFPDYQFKTPLIIRKSDVVNSFTTASTELPASSAQTNQLNNRLAINEAAISEDFDVLTLQSVFDSKNIDWTGLDSPIVKGEDGSLSINYTRSNAGDTGQKWAVMLSAITGAKKRYIFSFEPTNLGGTNADMNLRLTFVKDGAGTSDANYFIEYKIQYSQFNTVGAVPIIIDLPSGCVGQDITIFIAFDSVENNGRTGVINVKMSNIMLVELGNADGQFYNVTTTQFQNFYEKTGYFFGVKTVPLKKAGVSVPAPYAGKKLVFLGDSITAAGNIQPLLVKYTGLEWSQEENVNGLNGYSPMGVGGATIVPKDTNSIHYRAFDVQHYNPDVIIVFGGQNDVGVRGWDINDAPYTDRVVNASVSFISAYKGIIQTLMQTCPNAKIVLVTIMHMYGKVPSASYPTYQDLINAENYGRLPTAEATLAIGDFFSLPVVNLWFDSGVNWYNAVYYYGDVIAGLDFQVHPTLPGAQRIVETILKKL
ncbi:MAG: hypothetical protein DI598_13860 [Pseudopedobacter saltans]|uniref:SGNH hydrolase-type esterase domain-containing protein n=1 Tax=Pseudopedobacter saltans TaxID=151895 RepID=A0A2W5ERC5_9SPHI|nr:MAG: hypothetical protein DI598_13860 [Pseudopedobacter saltans]